MPAGASGVAEGRGPECAVTAVLVVPFDAHVGHGAAVDLADPQVVNEVAVLEVIVVRAQALDGSDGEAARRRDAIGC